MFLKSTVPRGLLTVFAALILTITVAASARASQGVEGGYLYDAVNIRTAPYLSATVIGLGYTSHAACLFYYDLGDTVNGSPWWYNHYNLSTGVGPGWSHESFLWQYVVNRNCFSPTIPAGVSVPQVSDATPSVTDVMPASALTGVPTCLPGQSPIVNMAIHPRIEGGGATSVEAALTMVSPSVGSLFPWSESLRGAPVWIVVGDKTFVANMLHDGTWFVSPATFAGCRTTPSSYIRTP